MNSKQTQPAGEAFEELVSLMARLRAPDGCPWDREQTHESLRKYLVEESYEVLEAIEKRDDAALREELGDLLLQPVFHAQLAAEEGRFSIADALRAINEKLVRRHPHIFGDAEVSDSAQVLANWEAIKKQEKSGTPKGKQSVLGDVSWGQPSLSLAMEVSKKAAKAGFEWPDEEGVRDKLREEVAELDEALASGDKARQSEELGDVMFTLVNIARWRKLDAELSLRDMVRRFTSRFEAMEALAQERNLDLQVLAPAQWDELWNESKTREKMVGNSE
jgi:tetrapyrrole methylase family protein/MazG family protein